MNSVPAYPSGTVTYLAWLPDETFFSLCSRLHVFSGDVLPGVTASRLFGLPRSGVKHDLPCGLSVFEERSSNFWGDATAILTKHTIFPFFASFQSAVAVAGAVATLRGGIVGGLKYRLGLIASGFGADHPLKACPMCIEQDRQSHGFAYWHLTHQYPGVLVCLIHRVVLTVSTQNRRWRDRFAWTLPTEENLEAPSREVGSAVRLDELMLLANASMELASIGCYRFFDPSVVNQVYRNQLQGLSAAQSFLDHVEAFRCFHPFHGLPGTMPEARCFIDRMTRSPRYRFHPLSHLMMITWLFDDLTSFVDSHDAISKEDARSLRNDRFEDPKCDQPLVRRGGSGTLRPKKLRPAIREQLLDGLRAGKSKQLICARFGVTVSTVNKIMRAEPDVHADWRARQDACSLSAYRGGWLSLRHRFPSESVSVLRAFSPATYAWLYRNDRDWLQLEVQQMPKAIRLGRGKVDWSRRDDLLCSEIAQKVSSHCEYRPSSALTRSQLLAIIPRLSNCLEKRDRYPKARRYLASICNSQVHFPGF